ncbi:MAG: ATP-binding protein [Desulfomonilaceae bacterium]|nr:ATP-binding protein [Desulfomonilaceae bacterium]
MHDLTTDQSVRILDSLPCYVTLMDRRLRVLWSNDAAHRDFGDPLGKTCYELFRVRGDKCSECLVEQSFQDGAIHNKEMTLVTAEGDRIDVLVYSSPVRGDNGEIASVVETAVNISSVKEMQKQLILLGQTVAGLAHGLKNIMMGLDGGIYVVNRGLQDKNQAEVREGWEMVLFNFDKISKIVKDILYCSKDREPNIQEVQPNSVIREVSDLFRETARGYGITLQLDLDEEVTHAEMDPDGLHSVITNLVANAIDACKMDLWKDEHLIEIRSRKGADGSVTIEVADNGTGIDRDTKDQIFEDFFSSKGDKGTGLGLMVTQKIMKEHGGSITFRSRPGQGTTFTAKFPHRET